MEAVLNFGLSDSTYSQEGDTAELAARVEDDAHEEEEDPRPSGGAKTNAWARAVRSLGEAVARWCKGIEQREVRLDDCKRALRLVSLATELTAKAQSDLCHSTDDKAKTSISGALAVCVEARDELRRAASASPLQLRLFAQTYRSRLSTSLQKVETATAAADEAVFFSRKSSKKLWAPHDPELLDIAKGLDGLCRKWTDEATPQRSTGNNNAEEEADKYYDDLVQEALAIVDVDREDTTTTTTTTTTRRSDDGDAPSSSSSNPAVFLKLLEATAVGYGCCKDTTDFRRQLNSMQRDEVLGDDIAASRANAETDVEDDEEYLRSLMGAKGTSPEDVSSLLAQRQVERDEVREHLAVEQCLHAALRAIKDLPADGIFLAAKDEHPPPRRHHHHLKKEEEEQGDVDDSDDDDDPEESDDDESFDESDAGQSVATTTIIEDVKPSRWRVEAARLDAETAKLVAETALIEERNRVENERRDAEEEQLAQSRQLYEAALRSRQEAIHRSSFSKSTSLPAQIPEEDNNNFAERPPNMNSLSDDDDDDDDDREDDDDPYYGGEDPKKGRVHRPRMSRRPRVARATTDKHIMQTTAPSTSDEESLPLSSPDVSFHHRKLPREVASVASELGAVEDISDVTQRRFDTARRARAASRLADACSVDGPEASAKARNGVTRPMIETLIAMLNTHCKQPELDEFARALGAVAFDCPRNKVSMMEAGVVPVVLARVADPHCDHRYVVPLWRTLAAETGKYQSTLKRAAYGHSVATSDSSGASFLAENLCQIIATSYDAEELLLAARTVLSLLKHDAKHHHHQQQQQQQQQSKKKHHHHQRKASFRKLVCDKGGLRGLAHVLDRQLRASDDGDELLTSAKAKTAAAKALMQLLFHGPVGLGLDIATPEGASAAVDAVRGHVIDLEHSTFDEDLGTSSATSGNNNNNGNVPRPRSARSLSEVVSEVVNKDDDDDDGDAAKGGRRGGSTTAMNDADLAILALTRALFDVMVAAARRPPQQQNGATSMAFVIRELIVHVAHQSPQISARATNVSWVIKEQAAKALRKLIKLSSDADVAAAVKKSSTLRGQQQHSGTTTTTTHGGGGGGGVGPTPTTMTSTSSALTPGIPHPRAERLVQFAVRCDAVPALAGVVTDATKGSDVKRAVFAKQEAAHVLRVVADHSPSMVDPIVNEGVIPALVRLVDVVDKDANKEAAATALWALCKHSPAHREALVAVSNGLPTLMHLVARTGTNAGDEAAASLLAAIATDNSQNVGRIHAQHDVFPDMVRTVEWNVVYGDTPAVKAAAKLLRSVLGLDPNDPDVFSRSSSSQRNDAASDGGSSYGGGGGQNLSQRTNTKRPTFKKRASSFFFRSKSSLFNKKAPPPQNNNNNNSNRKPTNAKSTKSPVVL